MLTTRVYRILNRAVEINDLTFSLSGIQKPEQITPMHIERLSELSAERLEDLLETMEEVKTTLKGQLKPRLIR